MGVSGTRTAQCNNKKARWTLAHSDPHQRACKWVAYGAVRPFNKASVCVDKAESKSTFVSANSSRINNWSNTGECLQADHALATNNKKKSENCFAWSSDKLGSALVKEVVQLDAGYGHQVRVGPFDRKVEAQRVLTRLREQDMKPVLSALPIVEVPVNRTEKSKKPSI